MVATGVPIGEEGGAAGRRLVAEIGKAGEELKFLGREGEGARARRA